MDSTVQHPSRRHRLSSLLSPSHRTQSEQSDGIPDRNHAPQSKRRRAWEQLTSVLPWPRPQETKRRTIEYEQTTEADDVPVETIPPMKRDEESRLPAITTVSIPVTSYIDNRPFYKVEDLASRNNTYVQRALKKSLDICYSDTNRYNPSAARADLTTLVDDLNFDIDCERLLQIKEGSLREDASLIVIKLMPSLYYDSDDPEGDLRDAPGTRYPNPYGLYEFGLSDADRTQLKVVVDAMRECAAKSGDRLELQRK